MDENKIRKARLEAKISQGQMSKMMDIPIHTLQKWETGERTSSKWAIRLIVKELREIGLLRTYSRKEINKKYEVHIDGEVNELILKEILSGRKKEHRFLIDVVGVCSGIFFSVVFSAGGEVLLLGYQNNNVFDDEIIISISESQLLLDDLCEYIG